MITQDNNIHAVTVLTRSYPSHIRGHCEWSVELKLTSDDIVLHSQIITHSNLDIWLFVVTFYH